MDEKSIEISFDLHRTDQLIQRERTEEQEVDLVFNIYYIDFYSNHESKCSDFF